MKKFSILSYSSGYRYFVYQRFVGTLFQGGYTGSVCLFIQRFDLRKIKKLQREFKGHNIQYRICTHKHLFDQQTNRWVFYHDFLKQESMNSDYFFICDLRDVLFQKDFSRYDYPDGLDLCFIMEDINIHQCHHNTMWIKYLGAALNMGLYHSIKQQQVSCGGTILGSAHGIKIYVKHMAELAKLLPTLHPPGVDQAMHMLLLYGDRLNGLQIKKIGNDENLIYTMAACAHKSVAADGRIVNRYKKIPYIAHQYDRLPHDMRKRIQPSAYNFHSKQERTIFAELVKQIRRTIKNPRKDYLTCYDD